MNNIVPIDDNYKKNCYIAANPENIGRFIVSLKFKLQR